MIDAHNDVKDGAYNKAKNMSSVDGPSTSTAVAGNGNVAIQMPEIPSGFEAVPCIMKQSDDTSVWGFLIRPKNAAPPPKPPPQPKAIRPKIAAKPIPNIAPYGNVEAQVEPCGDSTMVQPPGHQMWNDGNSNWQQPSTSNAGYVNSAYGHPGLYVDEYSSNGMAMHTNGYSEPSTSSNLRPQLDWSTSQQQPQNSNMPISQSVRRPPEHMATKVIPSAAQHMAHHGGSDASATPDSGVHSINGSPQMHTPPIISPGGGQGGQGQPQGQQLHIDTTANAPPQRRGGESLDDMPVLDACATSQGNKKQMPLMAVDGAAMNPEALAENLANNLDTAQLRKFHAALRKQVKQKMTANADNNSNSTTSTVVVDAVVNVEPVPAVVVAERESALKPKNGVKRKRAMITFEDEQKRRAMAEKLRDYRLKTARLMSRLPVGEVPECKVDELAADFEGKLKITNVARSKFDISKVCPPLGMTFPENPTKIMKLDAVVKLDPSKSPLRIPKLDTSSPMFNLKLEAFSKPTPTSNLRSVSSCSTSRPDSRRNILSISDDENSSVFTSPTGRKHKVHQSTASLVPHKIYLSKGGGRQSLCESRASDLSMAASSAQLGDMKLPYDIWFELRGARKMNPSRQYRKIRSNIYIDQIASTSQSAACTCSEDCGENCLNRQLLTECTASCCGLADGKFCSNRRLQTRGTPRNVQLFDTGSGRGMGVRAVERIGAGALLGEYVGEVLTTERLHDRQRTFYSSFTHHYAVAITSRHSIDAYLCGNVMRYINHSCTPNAEMQKWIVNGQPRVGVYALRDVDTGEELTYDYQFASHNRRQTCLCGAAACRKTIAPESLAGEQLGRGEGMGETTNAEKRRAQKKGLLLWRCRRKSIANVNNYAFVPRPRDSLTSLSPSTSSTHQSPTMSIIISLPSRPAPGDGLITSTVDLSYVHSRVRVGEEDEEQVVEDGLPPLATGDDQVRCVCGCVDEDGEMVQCDKCSYWLHMECSTAKTGTDAFECQFCVNKWTAPPKHDVRIVKLPEIVLPNCTYYRSFLGRCMTRINEFVYVKSTINDRHKQRLSAFHQLCYGQSSSKEVRHKLPAEVEESDDELVEEAVQRANLRVFRVHRLLKGPDGSRYVFGNYYARPHETFCEPTRRFTRQELLQTPLYDTLPLSAVVARCCVMDSVAYSKGRPTYPRYTDDQDVYMCEFRVDKGQRLFEKITNKTRLECSNTEAYIFASFDERRAIKRTFTPFIMPADSHLLLSPTSVGRPPRLSPMELNRGARVSRLARVVKQLRSTEEGKTSINVIN